MARKESFLSGTLWIVFFSAVFGSVLIYSNNQLASVPKTVAVAADQPKPATAKQAEPAVEIAPVPFIEFVTPIIPAAFTPEVGLAPINDSQSQPLYIHHDVNQSAPTDDEQQFCMGRVIFGEGRDLPEEERILIGLILNVRAADNISDFGGNDICGAAFKEALRRDGFHMFQFDGVRNLPALEENKILYRDYKLAGRIRRGEFTLSEFTKDIRYFYARSPKAYAKAHGVGKSWLERCTIVVASLKGHYYSKRSVCKPPLMMAMAHVRQLKPKPKPTPGILASVKAKLLHMVHR